MSGPQKHTDIVLLCELCPRETGVVLKLGELAKKIPGLKLEGKGNRFQHGVCDVCKKELEEGCTFFISDDGKCMKVSLEATKAKIQKQYWGKVLKIPRAAMNELFRNWAKENLKLAPMEEALPQPPPALPESEKIRPESEKDS